MAGREDVYQEAIRRGHSFAWEGKWEEAAAEYRRALAEFPQDPKATAGLGLAYLKLGRLQDALEVYQHLARLAPNDPAILQKVADLQERLNQTHEAAQTLLLAAELQVRRQGLQKTLPLWERAVQLAPDIPQPHERLARAYHQLGQSRKAVRAYLNLASVYQAVGQVEKAEEACQRALEMDPHNTDVLNALDAIRYGEPLLAVSSALQPSPAEEAMDLFGAPEEEEEGPESESPVEATRQKALTELASALLEETLAEQSPEAEALLIQAIDYQTRGEAEKAIAAYEQAVQAGADRPAIHFNLGLLYQQALRFDEAVEQFNLAVQHPEYAMGSYFALGECLRAQGRIGEALKYFLEVLKLVDLSTVRPEQAEELLQVYDGLTASYTAKDEETIIQFINALVEFLSGKGWERKAQKARRQLDSVAEDGRLVSLAEILAVPNPEQVLESLALIRQYQQQGMLYTAKEECFWAIQQAPDYLPLHLYLANIFLQENELERAVAKYLAIADTYSVRGEVHQAMRLYRQVLEIAPMDLDVRTRLIELLVSHGEVEQALEEYLALANTYFELAQMERARSTYQEALQLASRSPNEKAWKVRILHRLGDIDMQLIDWRQAVKVYQQICQLDPEDEKARLRLMTLYTRLGRRQDALSQLDTLLAAYRAQGKTQKIHAVLEEAVENHPDDQDLRKRLARAYLESGMREKAIEQLDALGELQLEAGRIQEAIVTIRAIIALNPENVEAYRQLLGQLMSS